MKALITGGAGFIGSHLQDRLIQEGHRVAIVDSLRSGHKKNLHPQSLFYHVDIRDLVGLKKVFRQFQPEIIFHLAAQNEVPYSMAQPVEDGETNIIGMINLLQLSSEFNIQKFIYSNTGGAFYGNTPKKDLPVKEDYIINLPTSFYGVSKTSAELYLKLFGNIRKLPWISLRYANVYGPRQDSNHETGIVAIFLAKMLKGEQPTIYGDGNHTRDYIQVSDVVEANLKALTHHHSDYFNISTGKQTSNQAVFETIESLLKTGLKPIYAPDRPGDPRYNCLSPQKAKKILHWEPKITFLQGIRLTLAYYQHL